MANSYFNKFGKDKSNAQKKEEFRQEKRKARVEKNAYFEKKKTEISLQSRTSKTNATTKAAVSFKESNKKFQESLTRNTT